jgi:hypothetical protein
LDEFFSNTKDSSYNLSDENALKYMKMSAELSLIKFKNEEELISFKNDF